MRRYELLAWPESNCRRKPLFGYASVVVRFCLYSHTLLTRLLVACQGLVRF